MKSPALLVAVIVLAAAMGGCAREKDIAMRELRQEMARRRVARQSSQNLYQRGFEASQRGDTAEAAALFDRAVEVYDRNAMAWMALGILEFERNNLFEAGSAFHRAARLKPGRHEPRYNLALVLESARSYESAIREYETALELKPGDLEVTENLVRCYVRSKTKPHRARQLIADALQRETREEWRMWLALQKERLDARGVRVSGQ